MLSILGVCFLLTAASLSFRNFIWDLPLSKLYTNSLLSTLNARAGWNNLMGPENEHNVLFGPQKQTSLMRPSMQVCMYSCFTSRSIPSPGYPPIAWPLQQSWGGFWHHLLFTERDQAFVLDADNTLWTTYHEEWPRSWARNLGDESSRAVHNLVLVYV